MTSQGPISLRPEHPQHRALSQLVADFDLTVVGNADGVEVSGVSLSSSAVEPGDLYIGMPGVRAHGASYTAEARDRGAVAVLTNEAGRELAAGSGLPIVVVANPRAVLGHVAAWVYRTAEEPPTLFGVTGTNGKTSAVYLLNGILGQLGIVSGLSSTAERRIGDVAVTSSLTTPEASELHALLARMRESEVRAVAIEVSAQALTRHRIDGIVFDVVGFTNLSHDHLDDYADFEEYFSAKRELFEPERARRGVVTVDSEWGRRLTHESRIPLATLTTVEGVEADWHMTMLSESSTSTSFRLEGPEDRVLETSVPLLGWFMAANAALAIVMLVESGIEFDMIAQALERDGGIDAYIPGRAERISGDRGPVVYIDYGHSPDAFLKTLEAIRSVTEGRIIMVFGADGDRDTTKRVDMGAIAARGSDVVVVTDFHPRSEDPASIRRVLLDAARAAVPERELHEVADPATAFRAALALAVEGDVILYAGPGHEDYHEVAGVKIPYSAREDSKQALREAGWL